MTDPEVSNQDYGIDFERIKELISLFEQKKNSGEIRKYKEEDTKKDFILPLFEALGWNVYNRGKKNDSISAEETISKKRVDYGFRINGIPKFFLEAKSLKEDNIHNNPNYVTQAIDYAWMKSCSWAILTNFETIAVYNADWKESNHGNNLFFVLHPNDFLNDSRFAYLSKIAFENEELDKIASKYGKKQLKNPINKQLLLDMIHFREILSKDIVRNNQDMHLAQEDIDESVQRILDRLIFIRNAEDREHEENKLLSNLRQWTAKGKEELVREIWGVYKYYDSVYNSKLFGDKEPHLADKLIISNEVLQEVIEGLNQSKDNYYRYDFSIIESDTLGNIYEQYLGNILKSTPKRAKLEQSKAHRKEQGIYYTPSYIVDYIVRNTVGEYIKTHTSEEIRKVRILDPACGSGSFLMRAYKELENYWTKELKLKEGDLRQTKWDIENFEQFYSIKTEILKNNIFGVDLDPKAVEIAQLNLLLQISEKGEKLPLLQNNIKVGNSLIDDPSVSDKAFKWGEEFPEIMKEGGFDIIIGNPPYVDIKQLEPKLVKYFFRQYSTIENRMNLYSTFIEKAFYLLKQDGYFSFIIPNSILYNESYRKIRKLLINETTITNIVRLPDNVFSGVKIETIILVYKKTQKRQKSNTCEVYIYPRNAKIESIQKENCPDILNIDQATWGSDEYKFLISKDPASNIIINKIEENSIISLGDICDFSLGLTPYDKYKGHTDQQIKDRVFHSTYEKDKTFKPLLSGEDIVRYGIFWNKKEYISYGSWLGAPREKKFFTNPHIVVRQIISGVPPRIYAGYTEEELYNTQIGFNLISKDEMKFRIKYILAILNSKLMSYYHKEKYLDPTKTLFQKILIANAKKFPIKIIPLSLQDDLVTLVDKLIFLRKEIKMLSGKKNDKWFKAQKDLEKIDSEIDQEIYELYGLNEEEINLINSYFSTQS